MSLKNSLEGSENCVIERCKDTTKKLFFATCILPRVQWPYTWRTVGHVQVATWKHVVNPGDTKYTFRHVYFNKRVQVAKCIKIHVANS